MSCHHVLRASVIIIAGLAPLLWDQAPAQAGAADREAYYYRQKSWVPIELSGRVKHIKQVPLSDSGKEHTVIWLEPDHGQHGRSGGYGRVVDLGANREFRHLTKGDHVMIWGNTAKINDMPVIMADAAEINDGKTIEVTRDPAFRKGYIWGRPLRDEEVYDYQNIDVDDTRPGAASWYFDSYEYVGYPYRELPPGASAPWARDDDAWKKNKQRRAERFQKQEERYARSDDRYADDERYAREDRMDRRHRRSMGGIAKSDQQLKKDVENELMWSPSVDSDKVSVSVRDGVVTLKGKVEDPEAIDDVIADAYEAGAKQVISKLTTEQ